jgi:hypothetical protein
LLLDVLKPQPLIVAAVFMKTLIHNLPLSSNTPIPHPCCCAYLNPILSGQSGSSIGSNYVQLTTNITADAGSPGLPMWVTEHNSATASTFDGSTTTTDTPSRAVRLAGQLAKFVQPSANGVLAPPELYVFRATTSPEGNGSKVKKNGIMW